LSGFEDYATVNSCSVGYGAKTGDCNSSFNSEIAALVSTEMVCGIFRKMTGDLCGLGEEKFHKNCKGFSLSTEALCCLAAVMRISRREQFFFKTANKKSFICSRSSQLI
jgi:hypothetical protein